MDSVDDLSAAVGLGQAHVAGHRGDQVGDAGAEAAVDVRPLAFGVFDQVVKYAGDEHVHIRDAAGRPEAFRDAEWM